MSNDNNITTNQKMFITCILSLLVVVVIGAGVFYQDKFSLVDVAPTLTIVLGIIGALWGTPRVVNAMSTHPPQKKEH